MAYRDSRFRRAVYDADAAEDEGADEYGESGTMGQLAALLPKPDAQMDERWRVAENQALDHATPEQYGAAEGVRDFAPMAVGSVLDILINKGKGLGALAAGGMQALSSESSRRDAARAQSAKEALAIKQQRDSGGDRMTNSMHALLRGGEFDQRRREQRAKLGSPEEQQQRRDAELAEVRARTGKLDADAKNSGLDDLIRYMGILGTQEGNAAKLALAERVAKNKEESIKLQREQAAADKEKAAKAERDKTRSKNGQTFNRMGKDDLAQATVLSGIEPLLKKYGSRDRPGVGEVDSMLPNKVQSWTGGNEADSIQIKSAIAKLFTRYSHGVTGATSSDKERGYNQLATQLRPGASEAETTAGLNAARKEIRASLRGLAKPDEEAAREVLRDMGLEDFVYGDDFEYGGRPQLPPPSQPQGPIRTDPNDPSASDHPTPYMTPSTSPPMAPTDGTPVRGGSWPTRAPAPPPPSAEADKPATSGPAQLTAAEQQEMKALMAKVPPEQFDNFSDRLLDMQPRQQLEFLRGLMGRQAAKPATKPATKPPAAGGDAKRNGAIQRARSRWKAE